MSDTKQKLTKLKSQTLELLKALEELEKIAHKEVIEKEVKISPP